MHFSTLLAPLLLSGVTSLASPTKSAGLRVSWRNDKNTSKSQIDVFGLDDPSKGSIGSACGTVLKSGSFSDFPIILDVDQDGRGNLTAGSASYRIHSNLETSGGITCSRIYNKASAKITCDIPYSGSKTLIGDNAGDCGVDILARNFPVDELSSGLGKRGDCIRFTEIHLVDDGNPHQDFYHQQVSENQFCGSAASCGASHQEGQALNFNAQIGGSGGGSEGEEGEAGRDNWFNGGFSVDYSFTTSDSYTCNSGPGETVCVWYNMAHTAYTVHKELYACSAPVGFQDPYVLRSPNNNNVGGGFYCVEGTACRSNGQGYWENGRAGGP